MNSFDLHGAVHVANTIRRVAGSRMVTPLDVPTLKDAAADIEARHSNDRAQATLRVALRNALLRVTNSDTKFCPSTIFRAVERGEMGVGEATDAFERMFMEFGDKRWMDGVEGTALSFGA